MAVAPDGSLVLIEIKRDRTPREVVAQALDYASWVEQLRSEEIVAIYARFAPGASLTHDLRERFGKEFDEESLNESHQIIIVAASLDDSTERIVAYLSERDIPINVLCFQVFAHGTEQLLSRCWLLDPVRTQVSAAARPDDHNEPWNGEFYCNFGHSHSRSWAEAVQFGFISAGGPFYTRTLNLLNTDGRIWLNVPRSGYVGVGRATGHPQRAQDFKVTTSSGDVPVLEVVTDGSYHREFLDDPERCEYFVPVQWQQTVSLEKAVHEIGLFGNQNTVCKPTSPKWRSTVERFKVQFPNFDKMMPV